MHLRADLVQRLAEAPARQGRRANAEKEDDVRPDSRATRVQLEKSAARPHELRGQKPGANFFEREVAERTGYPHLGRLNDLPPDLLSTCT